MSAFDKFLLPLVQYTHDIFAISGCEVALEVEFDAPIFHDLYLDAKLVYTPHTPWQMPTEFTVNGGRGPIRVKCKP